MVDYYIAIKWSKAAQPDRCRLTLYRYHPALQTCSLESISPLTAGQLLCHIECTELDNWQYVKQLTLCDFTLTCYHYPVIADDCDMRETKIIVIEYLPPAICHAVGKPEPYTSEIETGGIVMKEHQLSYSLTPAEFQAIYNLLLENSHNEESQMRQYTTIQNLAVKMRNSMDDWLLHYPLHPYTQWRMVQLREHREELLKLYGFYNSAEEETQ